MTRARSIPNIEEWEEFEIATADFHVPYLQSLLARLSGHDSRLLIRFESGIGIAFWVHDDETLELNFGDPARELWGCCEATPAIGFMAIQAGAANENLRDALAATKASVLYFSRAR
ncbi:MAG: hypothetical protein U0105_28110 [Candidatus Obscuribacterales bacterium]